MKDLKSTVDKTVTLLTTVVELIEARDPEILDIGKMVPDFEAAATGIAYLALALLN